MSVVVRAVHTRVCTTQVPWMMDVVRGVRRYSQRARTVDTLATARGVQF